MTQILGSGVNNMKYIEMTIDEALKHNAKTVLVAVQDLEEEETCVSFVQKSRCEYEKIIREAETLVQVTDDFVKQLRAFTVKQPDIRNIYPHGKLSTILLKWQNRTNVLKMCWHEQMFVVI